jgi:hypothetical protein
MASLFEFLRVRDVKDQRLDCRIPEMQQSPGERKSSPDGI